MKESKTEDGKGKMKIRRTNRQTCMYSQRHLLRRIPNARLIQQQLAPIDVSSVSTSNRAIVQEFNWHCRLSLSPCLSVCLCVSLCLLSVSLCRFSSISVALAISLSNCLYLSLSSLFHSLYLFLCFSFSQSMASRHSGRLLIAMHVLI